MTDLVEIDNLVITYMTGRGPVRALDGAQLTVAHGETLAIVGESGSGKTTLGMAAGKLLPSEAAYEGGMLTVAGLSVFPASNEELRALRRDQLGFVFQNPMTALDPTRRIGRQVARAMGGRASPTDVAVLLRRAELEDAERVMASFPHQLSGGMAQRVVIAMAIARRPKLIIADEPTASLDASIRDRVMATLRKLRDETGASLLILSHDLRMIARHADRVAVMYGGRIVEIAERERLFSRPAHPYTKALIAAASGNERPGERLVPIAGSPPVLLGRSEKCAFEPRCSYRAAICASQRPEERTVDGRRVACHLAEQVVGQAREAIVQ
jgi:oligopeptide/dipeptide ABC transporter ATP-binding protein